MRVVGDCSMAALLVVSALVSATAGSAEPQRPNPPLSGVSYASAAIRAQQNDDAANPGMLWVTRGEALWNEPVDSELLAALRDFGWVEIMRQYEMADAPILLAIPPLASDPTLRIPALTVVAPM